MKPTNHTQHLVHEVSYICKCMRTQDSDFTGSLCRQNDELCNLQGEIYLMSLPDPKGPWASCSSLLWETSAGKSWQCFTGELRQQRIPALHGTDLSTLFCPLCTYGTSHGRRGTFSDHPEREGCLGHIRGVRTNLPREGGGGPLKWHHIKHSHSPGFSTQEWHQEALCHPGGNAGYIPGAAALRDAAGGGTRHHAKQQCGAGGLTVTPPSATTGTDTTEAQQQHEVGAKPKRLVRKPRQIQSQRMLEETSQIREVILVCN